MAPLADFWVALRNSYILNELHSRKCAKCNNFGAGAIFFARRRCQEPPQWQEAHERTGTGGKLELEIPRDRLSSFEPKNVPSFAAFPSG
jgi:hypothetical protein